MSIEEITRKVLGGNEITEDEAYALLDFDKEELCAASAQITNCLANRQFDLCSIANARSGSCGENCKWCAQSSHFSTGVQQYSVINRNECVNLALHNARKGVHRYSLVASGRKVTGDTLQQFCDMYREIGEKSNIYLCASMGLMGEEELRSLWDAGVRRYHCNLETAPSFFPTLCSSHTIHDKLRTIAMAREVGMEICSGGIIGMGESERQRVEFALTLREAHPVSIPINLLIPIAGTPLETTEPLTEDEILTTIAVMRFVHPRAEIRLAAGRSRLSQRFFQQAVHIGINGCISGDMLTTTGSDIDTDRAAIRALGYGIREN